MNRPKPSGGKANTPDFYHYYYSQPLNGPSKAQETLQQAAATQSSSSTPQRSIDVQAIAQQVLQYLKYTVKQPIFCKIVAWLIGFWIFIKLEFGAVYVVLSGFGFIFFNLGDRKKGEQSAYNVFNKGHKELLGTLNAKQFENELMMRGNG